MCWPSPGTRCPKWISASTATPASYSKQSLAQFFAICQTGHLAQFRHIRPRVEGTAAGLTLIPGTSLSRPTIRLRRSRTSARIASAVLRTTHRCDGGPLRNVARAAIGVGDPLGEGRCQRFVGRKPMRQPVIAQVFDAPSEMMQRSCMSGRLASDWKLPSNVRRP